MTSPEPPTREQFERILAKIVADLESHYPKTVLLFGSLAHLLETGDGPPPNDIDLIVVGNNPPYELTTRDYGFPVEPLVFRVEQITALAYSLRYDPGFLALSKLYSKNIAKAHARDVIAAALLLGPGYGEFGIEQIEIEGRLDERDYSLHRVLSGNDWWGRLCAYARTRRGSFLRWSDRLAGVEKFS
ncbi:MAG: nucleotidyltransferase domain-containing protein [Desulfobacterales bacterium]